MLTEALVLGLSTGTVCSLHCIPSSLPFLSAGDLEGKPYIIRTALFLTGRLLGYAAFGAILGILGLLTFEAIGESLYVAINGWSNFGIGVLLLFSGILFQLKGKKICQVMAKYGTNRFGALFLGLITGINICPPFLAASSRAFSMGSVVLGVLYFLLFFVGTSIYFIPLFLLPILKKYKKQINILSRMTLIFMGLYFVYKGVIFLWS